MRKIFYDAPYLQEFPILPITFSTKKFFHLLSGWGYLFKYAKIVQMLHSRLKLDWERQEKTCFSKALQIPSPVSSDNLSLHTLEPQTEMCKQSCFLWFLEKKYWLWRKHKFFWKTSLLTYAVEMNLTKQTLQEISQWLNVLYSRVPWLSRAWVKPVAIGQGVMVLN